MWTSEQFQQKPLPGIELGAPMLTRPRRMQQTWHSPADKIWLTLYSTDTHFDASTIDSFWKHRGKTRNCTTNAIIGCIFFVKYFWWKFLLGLFSSLTLYHTIPTFNNLEKEAFLKPLWEKKKMLLTSIFTFSHNVFYPFQSKFSFSNNVFYSII